MRGAALALVLAAFGCSHAAGSAPRASVKPTGVKYAVRAMEIGAGLEGNSLPEVFESALCSALFELNDKQVICADEVRALLKLQQERTTVGVEAMGAEEVGSLLDAPRQITPSASRQGDAVRIDALLVEGGATLGRYDVLLRADGTDVAARATEMAAQVLAPAPAP